jgi:AAA15 family ATPase/GTPase
MRDGKMARYIKELNIGAFRGIQNLKLNDLGDINILVGDNNSGKTSVLEAVKIMENPTDMGSIALVAGSRRSMNTENYISVITSLFHRNEEQHKKIVNDPIMGKIEAEYFIQIDMDSKEQNTSVEIFAELMNVISIEDRDDSEEDLASDDTNSLSGAIVISDNGFKTFSAFNLFEKPQLTINEKTKRFNSIYLYSNVGYYVSCVKYLSDSIANNTYKKDLLLSIIKIFDQSINDLSVVNSEIYLHDEDDNSKPFFTYGNGTQKAVLLAILLTQCENGIILIDEIDNAIHKSALKEVFAKFSEVCKNMNIQAFITTHSLEALDAMLETVTDKEFIRVITLKKKQHGTFARVLSGDKAFQLRIDNKAELR